MLPENNEEPQNCVICLDTVSCRGKLSVCQHWFCFSCILEWAKNTNTCPVCKLKFRCITKTHVKKGKSPPQKVRVKDVDQRVQYDDHDDNEAAFIWAELSSSQSENEISDYSPSDVDDPADRTFTSPVREWISDSDNVSCSKDSMSDDSDSDAYFSKNVETTLSDDTSSESESDGPSTPPKKAFRRIVVLDSEESSSHAAEVGESSDDEWQTKETNGKPQRKRIGKSTNGYRKKKQPPKKSSPRQFEAELQRRRRAKQKNKGTKSIASSRNDNVTKNCTNGKSYSCTGQWLSTVNRSRSTSSRNCTCGRTSQRQSSNRQRSSTIELSEEESPRAKEFNLQKNRHWDSETSERKGISFKSSRNKRNSHTSSTREETNSACSETSLTRSETSLARSETSLTCSETSSTRYASRSTRNESSCPRQYRGTQPSCLPKSRKRLTFPFKSESAGYSSDDSWDPEGKSRRMSERKSEVPERLRPRTSTKRSRKDLRNTRPSKVLREMQNIL